MERDSRREADQHSLHYVLFGVSSLIICIEDKTVQFNFFSPQTYSKGGGGGVRFYQGHFFLDICRFQ